MWRKKFRLLQHRSDMQALASALQGRKLFVTGGTGFVGRSLLDVLHTLATQGAAHFDVTVLSRDPAGFLARHPHYAKLPWLSFLQGSLSQWPAVNAPYTDVLHAAADTHHQGNDIAWTDQIVQGTRRALDFAVAVGAQRFLMVSSGAVYGPQPDHLPCMPEDHAGAPPTTSAHSTYGQAKRMAEQLCTLYAQAHGLQTVIARCFAFGGAHLPHDGPYALGNFVRDALSADIPALRVKGDGRAVRSYLDSEEMGVWLLTLLRRGQAGEAYNVGSDQGVSMLSLAQTVASVLAPHKDVVVEGQATASAARSLYVPCVAKAAGLGLVPQRSLQDIIRRSQSPG